MSAGYPFSYTMSSKGQNLEAASVSTVRRVSITRVPSIDLKLSLLLTADVICVT